MKLRLAIPLAAAAIALAAGCSSTNAAAPPAGSGTSGSSATIPLLTVGDVSGYSNVDPNKTQGCNDQYCGLFMEHLLKLGPHNNVEPYLASVTQTSPVTYVYHLRHGVKFWDGHEMTSADVVYSLDYQAKRGVATSVYFTNVKTITATGTYTVKITLKQPDAGWKYSLTYEGVIFEKSFALAHPSTMGNPGVLIQGTGPWKLDSLDPTSGAQLSANPAWWGGKVPVRHITVKFFSSESSEALAMRAGEVDVAFPQNGKTFASTSGAKVTGWLCPCMDYFAMNSNVGPWKDIHVRRAVAYALNRPALVAANGGPTVGRPADSLIPPADLYTLGSKSQVDSMLSALPQYPYSLAKARQQMAQSAYPHGFTTTMDIDNSGNDQYVGQAIAAQLKKVGITLNLHSMTSNQYYSISPAKVVVGLWGLGAVSPDPSIFPSYTLGSAATYNAADYSTPEVNHLLQAGLATSDPAKRLTDYIDLLRNVAVNVPYVAMYQTKSFTALSAKYTLPPFYMFNSFVPWALGIKLAG